MLGSLASGLCAFVHVHRAAPRCMYARYTAKYRVFVYKIYSSLLRILERKREDPKGRFVILFIFPSSPFILYQDVSE